MVDRNALRTNQILIISLVVLAFVLGIDDGGALVVAFVAVSLAVGAAWPGYGPLQVAYRQVFVPLGIVKPQPVREDRAQHRFAQSVGAIVLAIAAILLFAGYETAGWIAAALVVVLALVNLLFGFCAGCFVFLHLQRLRGGEAGAG